MPKQKRLPLAEEDLLEALWEQFPEKSREQVITLYARLLAAALRQETISNRTGGEATLPPLPPSDVAGQNFCAEFMKSTH